LVLLVAACDTRRASVRVTIPDLDGVETPVAGLPVTFLPYDRDSIIAVLEERAEPRPHAAELDSLFRRFRSPFTEYLTISGAADRLRRDSAGAAADSARARAIRDSLIGLAPALTRARSELDRARAELWPIMDSLRAAVRRWRSETYAEWDSIVRTLPDRRLANPVVDTTGPDGWVTVALTRVRWWVTASSIDPRDPNAEWYWNLAVTGDSLRLDPRTGRNRPRY
jgi:hypothetical protein